MKPLKLFPWTIYCDYEATLKAYTHIQRGGSEECDCDKCQNFVKVRDRIYPEDVLHVFSQLGIDYTKEVEVSHYNREKSGLHLYGGWFHFIGNIEYLDESYKPIWSKKGILDFKLVKIGENYSWYFSDNENDLSNDVFRNHPLVQINFFVSAPWVLKSKEPE